MKEVLIETRAEYIRRVPGTVMTRQFLQLLDAMTFPMIVMLPEPEDEEEDLGPIL